MKQFLSALLLLLLAASQVDAATTWWLRPSGGTTGTCSQARGSSDPGFYLRTFAALNACSSPAFAGGDTVKLKGGTYTEFMASGGFTVPAGSVGAPTILEAVGTETVIFTGLSGIGDGATFDFRTGHSYITLQGDIQAKNFKIDHTGHACEEGLLVLGTANHLTFRGMDVGNCVGNGISLFGITGSTSSNVIIEYSRVHHNGGVQVGTEQNHGIYLSSSNNTVRFTEIDNNSGYGLHNYDSSGSSSGNVFTNLNVHHNGTTEGAGVILTGNGSELLNSYIWGGTGGRGIQVENPATNVKITGVSLYNNATRELNVRAGATGTIIQNVAISNTIGSDLVVNAGSGTTFAKLHCSASDTGCTSTGDPLFVQPAIGDFHLQSGSPIKATGDNFGGVYLFDYDSVARTGIAIGAFEFVETPTPTVLVGQYSCDDVVTDSSGEGNNGTLNGGATYGVGQYNSGCAFDGINDYVSIADDNSLDLAQFTLEAWVNLTTVDAVDRVVIAKSGAYFLYATSSNPACPSGIRGGFIDVATGVKAVCYATPLSAATPAFLALTYDGTTLKLYVNGVLVTSQAGGGTIVSNSGAVAIGSNGTGGEFLQGIIDEVRIYNAPLTLAEIGTDKITSINPVVLPPTAAAIKIGTGAGALKCGTGAGACKFGAGT